MVGGFLYSQLEREGHEIFRITSNSFNNDPRTFSYEEICSNEDESFDYVVHCGAQTSKNKQNATAESFFESNLIKTIKLAEWSVRNKLRGFIFISGVHIEDYTSSRTNQRHKKKFSPDVQNYFESKWFAELYLQDSLLETATKLSILRIGSPIRDNYCDSPLVRAMVQACIDLDSLKISVDKKEALNLTWLNDLIVVIRQIVATNIGFNGDILSYSASVLSTIKLVEQLVGNRLEVNYSDKLSEKRFNVRRTKQFGKSSLVHTNPNVFLSEYISSRRKLT